MPTIAKNCLWFLPSSCLTTPIARRPAAVADQSSSACSCSSPPSYAMTHIARRPASDANHRRELLTHAPRLQAAQQLLSLVVLLPMLTSRAPPAHAPRLQATPCRRPATDADQPSSACSCSSPPSYAMTHIARRPAVDANHRRALLAHAPRLQAAQQLLSLVVLLPLLTSRAPPAHAPRLQATP
jgi:hypothetical protein